MNIIILGAGVIGSQLCKRLSTGKHNITIIETDPAKADRAREHLDAMIVTGSGSSYQALKEASIDEADILAALTNIDEVNFLACQIAKKRGVETTIARVRNSEFCSKEFLLSNSELGADFIIQPERITAKAIVRLIRQSSATDIVEFEKGKIQLIGLRLEDSSPILHTPLKELLGSFEGAPFTIAAIKRRQYTIIPRGEDLLLKGDQIFIVYKREDLSETLKFFGKEDSKIENIMILGGGQIGAFIAEELEKEMNIKIIERDKKRTSQLAGRLSRTLVIGGTGSDVDLLTSEGLADMDEYIAVTGDDETNIISCLVARHLQAPRTICLVANPDYTALAPSIGMGAVVSKQLITANAIQKFIRRRHVAYFAELPGVEAEIIEFIAEEKSKIVKKPLRDTGFPANAIVAAVMKNKGSVEILKGDDRIAPGDRVIVFTLPEALRDVEKFF